MSDDDQRAKFADYHAKSAKANEIADPVEREAAHRRIIEEVAETARAEARAEMANLEAAWAKYLGHYEERFGLYMVLDDKRSFSRLHGCQIIHFPSDWTDEQIAASLAEEEEDEGCHSRIVYWHE
jgi:hypothetical protein